MRFRTQIAPWLVLVRLLPCAAADPDALLMLARFPIIWRLLCGTPLRSILFHIGNAGFDPRPLERAGARLAGVAWQGRVLATGDRLLPLEAHYLRHVVVQQEWPVGTTTSDYEQSLRAVILHPECGVYFTRYRTRWQLACVRYLPLYGWRMVEYRVQAGHWMTGFHPINGLKHFDRPERKYGRWLRQPM